MFIINIHIFKFSYRLLVACSRCVAFLPWLVVVHGPVIVHKCLIHVTFTAHFGRRSGAAVGLKSCGGRR